MGVHKGGGWWCLALSFVGGNAVVHFHRILCDCVYIYTCMPGVCGLHHVHNVHVNCSSLTFYLNTATKEASQALCVCLITDNA